MFQAILHHRNTHLQTNTRQWFFVILISLLLHSALVLWFSSRRPDFHDVKSSEFKVGLISSQGMGETLQTRSPEIAAVSDVATEEAGVVTQQEVVEDLVSKQVPKVVPEQLPSVTQTPADSIELASVVTPETSAEPEVPPPEISDKKEVTENKIEESQPVKAVEISIPSATSIETDVIETTGISSELTEVKPTNDFFKPAEVLAADEPMTTLPIEQLAAVPAPQAIKPDNNPELANENVEILEIKARDVVIQRKLDPRHQRHVRIAQTRTGDDFLHPKQSPLGKTVADAKQSIVHSKPKDQPPLVVPKAYILELKSWLSLYKQYPQQAYRLRQEGVVIIGLVIDRSGKIISHEIRRSSGHQLLDQEVELMIQRAGKMPALPDDFPRDSLELLIPIRFKVKS